MSEIVAGARYVVGFMFDEQERSVLLIRKTRPAWQAGKLNGIGGRIEEGETPAQAMRREFKEEVGINCDSWTYFCTLSDERDWQIDFFSAIGPIWEALPLTDEQPEILHIADIRNCAAIPNLNWLIPMALTMKHERIKGFAITELVKDLEYE